MNLNSLFTNSLRTGSQLINYQIIRWRSPKKPFWLGVAKSKRFIVPEPRVIRTPEESAQNLILRENYNIVQTSLLDFIRNTDPKLGDDSWIAASEGKIIHSSAFVAEISKSYEDNAVWNAESARLREDRKKKREASLKKKSHFIMQTKEKKTKKQMEQIEEVIRKEKILSASYLTPENIDQAIENCLDNIENFDFAIDLEGNRYSGRESLRPELSSENLEKTTSTAV